MPEQPDRVRPSRHDIRAFEELSASSLGRVRADAQVWRNGYAMLASGVGVLLALVGNQLGPHTPWGWRMALTSTLGLGLVFVAIALWLTLTVEGSKKMTRLDLQTIVDRHNSVEGFLADQASLAMQRLRWSRWIAAVGAVLSFLGLVLSLWMPGRY